MCCRRVRPIIKGRCEMRSRQNRTERRGDQSVRGGLRNGQDSEHAVVRTVENEMNDEGLGQRAMAYADANAL